MTETSSVLPDPEEHLTNGWEPDAPDDDTLMRQAVLVHASWPVELARTLGRPWRRTDRWAGALVGSSGELTNPVILTAPVTEAEAAEVVAEIGDLVAPGAPYFLLSPWLTPDFARHGLALIGHPPLMLRFPAPRPLPAPAGVEVREVTDAAAARGGGAGAHRGLPDARGGAGQRARPRAARRVDPRLARVRRRRSRSPSPRRTRPPP